MFYKIIKDKEKLLEFIEWLPELEDNEKFYLSLFARKKYCPSLIKSSDKTQLKRFTSDKVRMFDKISQLEIPINKWKLRDMSAPQESLVLYINPNPRNMKKATELMGKKCWDLMKNKNYNLHAEAMSCIQNSKSRSVFVNFDIDSKDVDLTKLEDIFPNGGYDIIETRGGYHVLIRPSDINNKSNCFIQIKETFPVDQTGDNMIPFVGCTQGNFIPSFKIKT